MAAQGIQLSGGYGAGGVAQALRDLEAQRLARQQADAEVAALASSARPSIKFGDHLLIFGGDDQRLFLGCLTCPAIDADSLDNPYGKYGNKYSASSVLNKFSLIRNPYTSVSMCNPHALHPPIVVDGYGKFHGELTVSSTRPARVQARNLQRWLIATCESQ
jgi:hypothetical protein